MDGREEMRRCVNMGAEICNKIKSIYYPDVEWQAVYKDVAEKLTQFKCICRKMFNLTNKQDLELFEKVRRFSEEDVKEVFSIDKETRNVEQRENARLVA